MGLTRTGASTRRRGWPPATARGAANSISWSDSSACAGFWHYQNVISVSGGGLDPSWSGCSNSSRKGDLSASTISLGARGEEEGADQATPAAGCHRGYGAVGWHHGPDRGNGPQRLPGGIDHRHCRRAGLPRGRDHDHPALLLLHRV